jgi:protein-tyrosine phosphatase
MGQRMEAISIVGREVMASRGLVGLGYDSVDYCGSAIREVCYPNQFRLYASHY